MDIPFLLSLLLLLLLSGEDCRAQSTQEVEAADINTELLLRILSLLEDVSFRLSKLEQKPSTCTQETSWDNDTSINLALGRPAYQSSTYSWGLLLNASLAVDGNDDPNFHNLPSEALLNSCTHTNEDRNPWWAVYLGRKYRVHRVDITGRKDCCNERFKNAHIGASNVSPHIITPSINNFEECNFFPGPLEPGETRSFYCAPGPVTGMFVIVQLESSKAKLTLCEVKVYGVLN